MFGLFGDSVNLEKGELGFVYKGNRIIKNLKEGSNSYDSSNEEKFIKLKPGIISLKLNSDEIEFSKKERGTITGEFKFSVSDLTDFANETSLVKHFNANPDSDVLVLTKNKLAEEAFNLLERAISGFNPVKFDKDAFVKSVVNDETGLFYGYGIETISLEITELKLPIVISVNEIGLLYDDVNLVDEFNSGSTLVGFKPDYNLLKFSTNQQHLTVTNQEIISSDSVALRCSYFVAYKIVEPKKLVDVFNLQAENLMTEIENYVHDMSQIELRKSLADVASFDINAKRSDLMSKTFESLKLKLEEVGISLIGIELKDLTFPKFIQELFALRLEEQLKSQNKLEAARGQVAAARALKNAAEIVAGNADIKYIRLLETLEKLASKGRHTFVLSDLIKTSSN